jgi:glutamine amidotransferase
VIALVDYGMGNLRSVQKAFERCGGRPRITSNPKDIEKADKIILPGVGAFAHAMRELRARRLVGPLKEKIKSGTPYLGLCLGLQLLFSESEEGGRVKGFGIVPGVVRRFRGAMKIPHMGWNTVKFKRKNNPLFKGFADNCFFYFVHSYYGDPENKSVISATTPYGGHFCSAIWKENIFATQFHPEKSQAIGLCVIKNFLSV